VREPIVVRGRRVDRRPGPSGAPHSWLAPCLFPKNVDPQSNHVIVARDPRSATDRAARSALRFASLALATLVACKGDAPAATTRAAQSSGPADPMAPKEVVIARPASPYTADASVNGAAITGIITAPASLAAGAPIATGRDSTICGPTVADESVIRQGNGIGGALVWLDDIRRGRPLPLERRLELESDKCRLTPRVQGGVVGSAVNVLGHDDFRQHLRFLAAGEKEPRAAIHLGEDEQVIPTNRPFAEPGLVLVRDKDHPWPTAYLAVFDHPYFAVTAPNGTFRIDGVPPGTYRLKVWHERAKTVEQSVDAGAGGATINLELQ
jgi:hypothetical protein